MNVTNQQEQIATEAAEWLLRLEEDSGTQSQTDFVAWLKRSPRHIDEFLMVEAAYRAVHQFDPQGRIDLDALVANASAEIVPLNQGHAVASRTGSERDALQVERRKHWQIWAIAATVALTILGGLSFAWLSSQARSYATAVGEQRVFKLADGSLLHLNTHSRARVHFSKKTRDVQLLEGEALFTVRQEATRPFRVLTDTATVQAVGTAFNVYRRTDRSTLISVIAGRVNVSTHAARSEVLPDASSLDAHKLAAVRTALTMPLAAGEELNVLGDGEIVKRTAPDVTQTLSWRQRRLVFRETALKEVVAQFNRYNADIQLNVDSGAIAERRITGTFDADEPQAFIKFLEEDSGVVLERRAREVVVRGRAFQSGST